MHLSKITLVSAYIAKTAVYIYDTIRYGNNGNNAREKAFEAPCHTRSVLYVAERHIIEDIN